MTSATKKMCLEMGKASFECWEALEGPSSVRTLDNMHDYALELAMLGHEEDGIAMWQEIMQRCPVQRCLREHQNGLHLPQHGRNIRVPT